MPAEVLATGELELDESRWERELSERRYRVNSDAFLSVAEQVGQFMLEGLMSHNESTGQTARNHDPWFPGCPFFDGVNKDASLGCNLIRFNKDRECMHARTTYSIHVTPSTESNT